MWLHDITKKNSTNLSTLIKHFCRSKIVPVGCINGKRKFQRDYLSVEKGICHVRLHEKDIYKILCCMIHTRRK